MTYSFEGKVAIITGAGGGLGRCHALELARRGARVVVNDLGGAMDGTGGSSEAAMAVVEEIKGLGGEAIANGGSVSDRQGAKSMVTDAMDKWGRVDILINNAGILRDKSFAKMGLDDFQVVLDVHLMGAVNVTKEVWPIMREQNYGRIVMTTSPSGLYGNFGQTNYGAAKAGIAGFTRCLALEGKKYGIRCFILAPVALTRLTEDLPGFDNEEMQKRLAPGLVSPLLTYLVSDLSKDMSGNTFYCGGGRIAEMKVVTHTGVTKQDDGGLWSPQEIADAMKPGGILLPDA
jgi:NAD(P)-dependent dehydrogenase (short-subunit alcohol dehydrogenase family)